MIPGIFAGAMRPGGGGGGSFEDLILSHNPFMYFRHGEPSGTTAVNDGSGSDGTYSGGYSLGNAALYAGGPTSLAITANTGRCTLPVASMPASMHAMTLGAVWRPNAVTGVRQIITKDADSGGRRWQFRTNGGSIEFVKTAVIQVVSRTHGLSAGVPVFVACTVSATGVVKLFKNGVLLGAAGAVTAADYGSNSLPDIAIGSRATHNEGQANDRFSDTFIIASDISESAVMAIAVAGGFA